MPFKWIKRWWRSKGFGIHSPFAFYFILRVLREKLPYYAYDEIKAVKPSDIPRRDLLTLFRIVCHFAPEEVTLPEGTPKSVRTTLRLADSRIRITNNASKFQCYFGKDSEARFRTLAPVVTDNEGVIVIHRPSSYMLRIKDTMAHGMTFTNGNGSMLVIVVRHDLPRQDFVINF
ncbi:MAG: hypothetical protein J6A20_08200 [Muribaculaceae bacterium]|nr:hypothetical protein [Muribaculaceae bacterium]